jgi:phage gp36-like protein
VYCSPIDVRNALTPGATSDDPTTSAGLSDEQIDDAINQADARIRGYLPAGYVVPMMTLENNLTVATPIIRYWSRDIAAYLATLTFNRSMDVPQDEPVRLRYNDAMADLMLVAKGMFELPPETGDTALPSEENVFVYNQYQGQLFGPEDFSLATAGTGLSIYQLRARDLI